jgi:ADP-ribosylglycohydrolase
MNEQLERALVCLDGLSVGDALGERYFGPPADSARRIQTRQLPPAPWKYTDDTEMAQSIAETLAHEGRIDQDALAARFARRFRQDPLRGYGGGARDLLTRVSQGQSWRDAAGTSFNGQGSRGNGAAMRAAPIGAFFCDDPDRVVEEARLSAAITHGHPDGQAGAIAVALAAAFIAGRRGGAAPTADGLLSFVHGRTPDGPTRERLARALRLEEVWKRNGPPRLPVEQAARELGNGSEVLASDTVAFALWSAARHLGSFEETFWSTVAALGDRDTTCAISCGVAALAVGRAGIPAPWLEAREPLTVQL